MTRTRRVDEDLVAMKIAEYLERQIHVYKYEPAATVESVLAWLASEIRSGAWRR